MRTCDIDGCERKHLARGFCAAHYYRWREYGDPQADRLVISHRDECTVEGCSRKHLARGFCSLHYQRWEKHGDPEFTTLREGCEVEGCPHPHKAEGLCGTHYQRVLRGRPGARAAETERTYYRAHGLSAGDWQALWDAQEGCCRLCGKPMQPRNGGGSAVKGSWLAAVIHHDHRCCPEGRSCDKCRMLAHNRCNRIAGLAGNDPALLRRIAEGLVV